MVFEKKVVGGGNMSTLPVNNWSGRACGCRQGAEGEYNRLETGIFLLISFPNGAQSRTCMGGGGGCFMVAVPVLVAVQGVVVVVMVAPRVLGGGRGGAGVGDIGYRYKLAILGSEEQRVMGYKYRLALYKGDGGG